MPDASRTESGATEREREKTEVKDGRAGRCSGTAHPHQTCRFCSFLDISSSGRWVCPFLVTVPAPSSDTEHGTADAGPVMSLSPINLSGTGTRHQEQYTPASHRQPWVPRTAKTMASRGPRQPAVCTSCRRCSFRALLCSFFFLSLPRLQDAAHQRRAVRHTTPCAFLQLHLQPVTAFAWSNRASCTV